jgi:hypothetical protein
MLRQSRLGFNGDDPEFVRQATFGAATFAYAEPREPT